MSNEEIELINLYSAKILSLAATIPLSYIDNMEDEDLIEKEDMVVTVTSGGYIKRTALAEYREQKRGGKGLQGMTTKEDDVSHLLPI